MLSTTEADLTWGGGDSISVYIRDVKTNIGLSYARWVPPAPVHYVTKPTPDHVHRVFTLSIIVRAGHGDTLHHNVVVASNIVRRNRSIRTRVPNDFSVRFVVSITFYRLCCTIPNVDRFSRLFRIDRPYTYDVQLTAVMGYRGHYRLDAR